MSALTQSPVSSRIPLPTVRIRLKVLQIPYSCLKALHWLAPQLARLGIPRFNAFRLADWRPVCLFADRSDILSTQHFSCEIACARPHGEIRDRARLVHGLHLQQAVGVNTVRVQKDHVMRRLYYILGSATVVGGMTFGAVCLAAGGAGGGVGGERATGTAGSVRQDQPKQPVVRVVWAMPQPTRASTAQAPRSVAQGREPVLAPRTELGIRALAALVQTSVAQGPEQVQAPPTASAALATQTWAREIHWEPTAAVQIHSELRKTARRALKARARWVAAQEVLIQWAQLNRPHKATRDRAPRIQMPERISTIPTATPPAPPTASTRTDRHAILKIKPR